MSIFNSTNEGRVQKIVDITQLLNQSAQSNKASQEEIWKLLDPAITAISDLVQGEKPEAPQNDQRATEKRQETHSKPTWVSVREMAQEAPLPDLVAAVAIFLNRIDEHLNP